MRNLRYIQKHTSFNPNSLPFLSLPSSRFSSNHQNSTSNIPSLPFTSPHHCTHQQIPPSKTSLYSSFFCSLIELYLTCKRFSYASDAFLSMRKHGLNPNLKFWNRILFKFNSAGLVPQPSKSNKRKRTVNIGASKKSGITSAKRSPRKRRKIGDTPKPKEKSASDTEDEDEQEEGVKNENGIPDADVDEPSEHSESEKDEDEQDNDEESGKIKHGFNKSSWSKSVEDVSVKKVRTPKKISLATPAKSVQKTYSRQSKPKTDDTSDTSPRVFSRKKKNEDTPKKKPSTSSKSTPKAKAGKKVAKEKDKPKKKESGPSEEELRKTICEILKAVDFNTATFTDILKQLTSHFNADLTPRKSAIKLMIHDELTKLADEAEDDEDEESDDEKEEDSRPAGKVEA